MFGLHALEKYVLEGGKENAKEALAEMNKGAAMAEENYHALGQLMNKNPNEALKQLEDDANDDVEFWFTIGKDEPAWGIQQPYCEWEKVFVFGTKVEAEKEQKAQEKKMNGPAEWVTGIRRRSKTEKAAHDKVRELKRKVMDMEHDLDFYPKRIAKMQETLAAIQAEFPDKKKELEEAIKEYEENFGHKWTW